MLVSEKTKVPGTVSSVETGKTKVSNGINVADNFWGRARV